MLSITITGYATDLMTGERERVRVRNWQRVDSPHDSVQGFLRDSANPAATFDPADPGDWSMADDDMAREREWFGPHLWIDWNRPRVAA